MTAPIYGIYNKVRETEELARQLVFAGEGTVALCFCDRSVKQAMQSEYHIRDGAK